MQINAFESKVVFDVLVLQLNELNLYFVKQFDHVVEYKIISKDQWSEKIIIWIFIGNCDNYPIWPQTNF